MDYGLSLNEEEQDYLSKGTLSYVAPEIISSPFISSLKSDVFSMARVIALLWHVNLDSYNDTKIKFYSIEEQLNELFDEITDLEKKDEKIIRSVLKGMLEKNPEKRLSIDNAIQQFNSVGVVEEPEEVALAFSEKPTGELFSKKEKELNEKIQEDHLSLKKEFSPTYLALIQWFHEVKMANLDNKPLKNLLTSTIEFLTLAKESGFLKIKNTLIQVVNMDAVSHINYPEGINSAGIIFEELNKPSGKKIFSRSYCDKKIDNLNNLSQNYLIHLKNDILAKRSFPSKALEDRFLLSDPNDFNNQPLLKLALQKYQALIRFCQILNQEKSAEERLVEFKIAFNENKELLETRRDNAAITFLKGVLTIITVGIAYALGIWETKGGQLGKQVEAIQNPTSTF